MRYAYCTLFNSNYLDKGLVTICSLLRVSQVASVYVLAMDEGCYEVLTDLKIDGVIPIRLQDFENEELLTVKQSRTTAEYCWTCSGSLIFYILEHFKESNCTYIDADMYFYRDPSFLIDRMIADGKSVLLTEHGFKKDYLYEHFVNGSGRFCVEFNTFLNNEEALCVLKQWIDDILKECSADTVGNLGDQSYLTEWPEKYSCVMTTDHIGAGLAPWNVNRFYLQEMEDGIPVISEKRDGSDSKLAIFYHFHNVKYLSKDQVNIGVYQRYWKVDSALIEAVYRPYLEQIKEEKRLLNERYGITELVKVHPAWSNEAEERSFTEKLKKLCRQLWKRNVFQTAKNLVVRVDLNLRYRFHYQKDILDV